MECYLCGVSGGRKELVDVILDKQIKKVCRDCAFRENLYVIKKSGFSEIDKLEQKGSVRERLVSLTGVDSNKEEKSAELKRQEAELEKVVNQNVEGVFFKPKEDSNLIRNFHWFILRERRKRRLTQGQLARAISEPEMVIKKLERGEVPRERERLIMKIENYLGIKITKGDVYEPSKGLTVSVVEDLKDKEKVKNIEESISEEPQIDSFDPVTTKLITIGDLRDMKKKVVKWSEKFFGGSEDSESGEKLEDEESENQ